MCCRYLGTRLGHCGGEQGGSLVPCRSSHRLRLFNGLRDESPRLLLGSRAPLIHVPCRSLSHPVCSSPSCFEYSRYLLSNNAKFESESLGIAEPHRQICGLTILTIVAESFNLVSKRAKIALNFATVISTTRHIKLTGPHVVRGHIFTHVRQRTARTALSADCQRESRNARASSIVSTRTTLMSSPAAATAAS